MSEVASILSRISLRGEAFFTDRLIAILATLILLVLFIAFLVSPLTSILLYSFKTVGGYGLDNFIRIFSSQRFWKIVVNSLSVSSLATTIVIIAAYFYAFALQHTNIPFKNFFRLVVLVPLFAPSLIQAQGLILWLGRNGVLNRFLGFEIEIYGFWGIIIADIFYGFPYAFLILSAALAVANDSLYESATLLGASRLKTFLTVTLPSSWYALAAASFVVFTLVTADFGNPVIIGGNFNVLATEIYNKVLGQAQFGLGAVVGIVILLPAVGAKICEKIISKRQFETVTDNSRPLIIKPLLWRDRLFFLYVSFFATAILSIILIVLVASFIELWPYRILPTLKHYRFDVQNGVRPLYNSVVISIISAFAGVLVAGIGAYVSQKIKTKLTGTLLFFSILPSAVPGMVLGLGFLIAFNSLLNPLSFLYGTFALIIFLNIYLNHAQVFLVISTSLKQISKSFDEASTLLGASLLTTLRRITFPLMWQALLGMGLFYFMRSMVSLSAVVFLVTPETQVASVSVLQLSDRGAINQAAAFSICIMAIVLILLGIVYAFLRATGEKNIVLIR